MNRFPQAGTDRHGLLHRGLAFDKAAGRCGPVAGREMQFALAWQRENLRGAGLAGVLDVLLRAHDETGVASGSAPRPVPLDQAAASVAATTMQWLGSAQGFQFLTNVLEAAGYQLVGAAADAAAASAASAEQRRRDAVRERYAVKARQKFEEAGPVSYVGTVDGIAMSGGLPAADQAVADAVSNLCNGTVIEQLATRVEACVSGYAARQASPEQVLRYGVRCTALAERVLADADIAASTEARERLRRAISEWRRHNQGEAAAAADQRKVA